MLNVILVKQPVSKMMKGQSHHQTEMSSQNQIFYTTHILKISITLQLINFSNCYTYQLYLAGAENINIQILRKIDLKNNTAIYYFYRDIMLKHKLSNLPYMRLGKKPKPNSAKLMCINASSLKNHNDQISMLIYGVFLIT